MHIGFMDIVFSSFIGLIALILFTIVIIGFISAIKKNNYNNAQPVLTVVTNVVSKRIKVTGKNRTTHYYVTFEFENSDRLELKMKGNEYGILAEGDNGQLTFQGDRYLGFKRA